MIPAILHIDPMVFQDYPPGVQARIKALLQHYIAAGWAGPGPQKVPHG